ncbi:MAG: DUF6516 family protein [Caldilineaceae bacterium]
MTDPLRTIEDYELYAYSISTFFDEIRGSTLTLVRHGTSLARVAGAIEFFNGYRLVVRERLLYSYLPAVIDWYGYEVWKGGTLLFWYDSQPHPNEASLQSTHPHHRHIPPDIKHNRIPAPEMSFRRPNLPVLIAEIQSLIAGDRTANQ